MRIAIVNDHYATASPGGQHRIQNLGFGLKQLGHEVLFISPDATRFYDELPRTRDPSLMSWGPLGWDIFPRIWSQLKPRLTDLGVVIFELPMPVAKGLPLFLVKLEGIDTILDFGDIWFGRETHSELLRLAHNEIYRILCRAAGHVTVPTRAMAGFISKFANIQADRIPFCVDTQGHFNPDVYGSTSASAEIRDWAQSRVVIVLSGTLSEEKGSDLLPVVAQAVGRHLPTSDFGFLVIGDGPEREALKHQVEKIGLGHSFRFTKAEKPCDLPELISVASMALALSPTHGLSMAPRNINKIVEYLAMAKPVIAMRDANSEEYVRHAETGYLVDLEDIHNSILHLIQHPSLLEEMSRAARQYALSFFDCRVVASKLVGGLT